MPHDLSDAILPHLAHYAVGMVLRELGEESRVLGSGTLVSIEGRRGILTCGHVAERYERLPEIGLVRFAGTATKRQQRILSLGDTKTMIVQSSNSFEDGKEVLDLAFTALPPEIASSLEAQGLFLSLETNRAKMEEWASTREKSIDAVLGLVEEFSTPSFKEGREFISPMRGVLHSGHVTARENGLLTLKAMEYNRPQLPKCFGGMSGGGLWRIYYDESEDDPSIAAAMLCGVVSWQIDDTNLACQGWDRIDQGLVPAVRQNLPL
ncbi:hypothetical protein [Bradyrhizobium stylosanthis]|uniref:Trypsin-like peptidase n=1 Tax=Bradyrhizobium stylosanthis TaxID=1803665 RepID=A0A560CVW8_9BRAD|nr:hypothetical protein [Bradyrhizobium stylosanthis]TWA88994.1 hypothetical protein FBZ96_12210 [Bradyrhizobium stylosanthis]